MVSGCGRTFPCVGHKIPLVKAATWCVFAGTDNKVGCLHQCRQSVDMRLIPDLGAAGL